MNLNTISLPWYPRPINIIIPQRGKRGTGVFSWNSLFVSHLSGFVEIPKHSRPFY
jgi:hypothetical protein